jgi:hypothetical protein
MSPGGLVSLHPPPNASFPATTKSSSSGSSSGNATSGSGAGSLTYAGAEGSKVLMLEAEGDQVGMGLQNKPKTATI